jgi:hypothetical protein
MARFCERDECALREGDVAKADRGKTRLTLTRVHTGRSSVTICAIFSWKQLASAIVPVQPQPTD